MTSDAVKYNGATALTSEYTYDNNGNITSKLYAVGQEGSERIVDIINEYDDKNRITAMGYNEYFMYYQYDSDGQLIRVDNCFTDNSTSVYSYDSRGNITQKKSYFFTRNEDINTALTETKTFTYANAGWKDQLIAVNGVELTYDEIGNVLTYGNRSFTWNSGRNLQSIADGNNTYSYKYDENGIRTSKTVNGVTTYYNTKNGVILSQSNGTDTMYFQYDNKGVPLGFVLNGTQYFYITNQMGDVVAITESNGDIIGEYVYDEWGYILSENTMDPDTDPEPVKAVEMNPLRYRGYCYDRETGYYYLQSRYYDPSICRFINADIPEIANMAKDITAGTNIFAYCNNDPVNNSDPTGKFSLKTINAILGSFFNLFAKFLKKIFNKISNKIGITKNKVWFSLSTTKIATAIDVISGIASGIKGLITSFPKRLATHGLITFLKSYKKSGEAFKNFVKKEFLPNILNFAKKVVVETIAICSSIQIGKQAIPKLYYKALNAILKSKALDNISKIVNIFSSTGNIIGFVLDCFDGQIDSKLVVYKR